MSKRPVSESPKQAKITQSLKEQLVKTLETIPIFTAACDKLGIPRSTYYKWRHADETFAYEVDRAIMTGRQAVNGLAKTMLLKEIRASNMTAIIFWLKHNDPDFNPKITIEMKERERYSKEELALLGNAMRNMGFAGVVMNEKALRANFIKQADPEVRAYQENLKRMIMPGLPESEYKEEPKTHLAKNINIDDFLKRMREDGTIKS